MSRFYKVIGAPQGVLRQLYEEHERTRPRLLEQLSERLVPHMAGGEKLVYKVLKKASDNRQCSTVLEGHEEHKHAKKALKHLQWADPKSPRWDARSKVLRELIEHHIEQEQVEVFELARNFLGTEALGRLRKPYERRQERPRKKTIIGRSLRLLKRPPMAITPDTMIPATGQDPNSAQISSVTAMIVFPGVTPSKALTGLGVGSIAVGFAFKDIFENFFAGLLILWRFPFEAGDFIHCQEVKGKVMEVTIRNTCIRRVSGELVVVPNSTIFKNSVDVVTHEPLRRANIAPSKSSPVSSPAAASTSKWPGGQGPSL